MRGGPWVKVGVVAALALAALWLAIELRWKRTFEAPGSTITHSSDPSVIERGRALVYGAGHCANCHLPVEQVRALNPADRPPLVGGFVWSTRFGTFRSPNITPDPETGIGKRSDEELVRVLRFGIRHDGRAALLMELDGVSDEDLTAIISFLRAQAPVSQLVPDHQPNVLGRLLLAFFVSPPVGRRAPLAKSPGPEDELERGRYLTSDLALCVGCHTKRSPIDFSYQGVRFAGGSDFAWSASPGSAPNLLPDRYTGLVGRHKEDAFVARLAAGRPSAYSPMPWTSFANLDATDARAIYRYLRSLPPAADD